MQPNKTKAKLARGEVAFGSEIMFPSADVVEILGYAGLDFVYMDLEHSSTTHESLAHMIRAAEIGGATPLVRIPQQSPGQYAGTILRILDLGAMGVIVPHVDTREEAEAVVDAMKYRPRGNRGMFDISRVTGYGLRLPGREYVRRANEETLVVVMIESALGLENVEAILGVDGVDVVQIGSSDLSQSLGYHGDLTAPPVLAAIERIVAAARKAGVAPGVGSFAGFPPDRIQAFLRQGAQFVNITTANLLLAGVRHWNRWLEDARAGAAAR
jgi:4-hydroxy-2-oxoheptanedioate aldolase